MPLFKKIIAKLQEHSNKLREKRRQKLFLRIKEVLARELKIKDASRIKLTTRFREDLGMDSLSSLELMMGLEDEFGLDIPREEIANLLTVEDVVDYLEGRLKRRR